MVRKKVIASLKVKLPTSHTEITGQNLILNHENFQRRLGGRRGTASTDETYPLLE
jgi:hypothetical protein